MGAQVIVSPCAWAVPTDHDQRRDPYGTLWLDSYGRLATLFDLTVIGVSNVGMVGGGPWLGRPCIGNSLAIGSTGQVLAQGPYGSGAEALLRVFVEPQPPIARGADLGPKLARRGYREG
jgi:hypothetical protein